MFLYHVRISFKIHKNVTKGEQMHNGKQNTVSGFESTV